MDRSLLDAAIEEYGIPPWPYEAAFDRVIVYSLPEAKATRDTFIEGGIIYKVEAKKEDDKRQSPRAVLVSAGLGAMDVLRSHFMGLGHVLWVARLSPWRHEVEMGKDGKPVSFMFLRVGDIVGSETLQAWIRAGRVRVTVDQQGVHHYEAEDGALVPRFDPPSYVA